MSIDDLHRIMAACAGEACNGPLTAGAEDVAFENLGYDSLAVLETASRIAAEYGVHIADDVLMELKTPRELLDLVNDNLADAH